jgi:hypothetical protein
MSWSSWPTIQLGETAIDRRSDLQIVLFQEHEVPVAYGTLPSWVSLWMVPVCRMHERLAGVSGPTSAVVIAEQLVTGGSNCSGVYVRPQGREEVRPTPGTVVFPIKEVKGILPGSILMLARSRSGHASDQMAV